MKQSNDSPITPSRLGQARTRQKLRVGGIPTTQQTSSSHIIHSQLSIHTFTPSLKVHIYSHYHPIQRQKRLASSWAWAFILSRKTKGEKNGDDDGLGQEIQVSHSNCIVYMTGVVDEKDERACSPLPYLVVGHHEQVCRQVWERPVWLRLPPFHSKECIWKHRSFFSWKGFILSKSLTDIHCIFFKSLVYDNGLVDRLRVSNMWWTQKIKITVRSIFDWDSTHNLRRTIHIIKVAIQDIPCYPRSPRNLLRVVSPRDNSCVASHLWKIMETLNFWVIAFKRQYIRHLLCCVEKLLAIKLDQTG